MRTFRIIAAALPKNKAAVERLYTRFFFDPELAQYLLTRKVRDLGYDASNKWIRRALAVQMGGQGEGDSGGQ